MPNAELARKILDAIDNSPDSFDMDSWFNGRTSLVLTPDTPPECGTTMCVAGWAAHLTGWTLTAGGNAIRWENPTQGFPTGAFLISGIGQKALALRDEEADDLFFASNEKAIEILNHIATTGEYPPIDY